MKIKSRLRISTIVSICIAVVIGTVILLANHRIDYEAQQAKIVDDIAREINELEVLTYEYFLHHEEMVRSQWESKQQYISQILMSIESLPPHVENTLTNLKVSLGNIKKSFNQLILVFERSVELDQEHAALSLEYEKMLGGQLITMLKELASDILQMSHIHQTQIETTRMWTMRFIILFIITMALVTGISSFMISKSISAPIAKLEKGAKAIGAGVTDTRVDINTKDEIGRLAASFNKMAVILKGSQEQLLAAKETLRELIDTAQDAIICTGENGIINIWNKSAERIFEYTKSEIIGKPIEVIMPESCEKEHKEGFTRFLKTEKTRIIGKTVEFIGKTKEGNEIPIELSLSHQKTGEEQHNFTAIIRDITERKQAVELIKTSLKEKETLIGEVYHRTKNNMAVICSLLKMQSRTIKDKKMLGILKEMENRIRSMSLVHSKLYQSKNLSNINLKSYIIDLASDLLSAYHLDPDNIVLKLTADDVLVTIDSAVPCGLVINEIITNSLKYAFTEGRKGEIRIDLCKTDKGEIELKIADNGIGMPKGFNPKNTNTLGLQVIYNIVEKQLDGKIYLNCENGVEYQMIFKVQDYKKRI